MTLGWATGGQGTLATGPWRAKERLALWSVWGGQGTGGLGEGPELCLWTEQWEGAMTRFEGRVRQRLDWSLGCGLRLSESRLGTYIVSQSMKPAPLGDSQASVPKGSLLSRSTLAGPHSPAAGVWDAPRRDVHYARPGSAPASLLRDPYARSPGQLGYYRPAY